MWQHVVMLPQELKEALCQIGAVPKKTGRLCMLIDQRLLNLHLSPPKFKYEGLKELAAMLDWTFSIDLITLESAPSAVPGLRVEGPPFLLQGAALRPEACF